MRATPVQTRSVSATTTRTPDVSVIIVNYNVREFLEQALESVERAAAGLAVETFVIDNNSADGSTQMVREHFPKVRLIENEENVGFAAANNQAIREASGRHLLILNPDTLLQEDTLHALVRFMDEHPNAGAAGCRILNPDGTFAPESRRSFPTPSVALYRLTGLSRFFPHSPIFGRYNLTYLPIDQESEVDALSGSCMMVRHAALYENGTRGESDDEGVAPLSNSTTTPVLSRSESQTGAGLLDEGFFMYGEDLDWCYRIQQQGWKIYYTPETQIIHYKGESTKKGELRYVRLFYGAMLRFVEKHFSGNPEAGMLRRNSSRLLALGIRLGILVRALATFAGRAFTAAGPLLLDLLLVFGVMAATARLWSAGFGSWFYLAVIPAYALTAILGVSLSGGYRRDRRAQLRPVFAGLAGSLLFVATLSFFVQDIAFSRAVPLLGFMATGALLTARRLLQRFRSKDLRRTLLVGSPNEASRLRRLVGRSMRPSTLLLGFVGDRRGQDGDDSIEHLGHTRHLRDLVRLQSVDDVVFAADSLSNTAILGHMRHLRDLPVQFKILASGRDRIIGKASVEDFSVPFMSAERAVAPLRSALSRRLLEVPVALMGMAVHPLVKLLARLSSSGRLRAVASVTARMPSVLAGRRALVGFDSSHHHPPTDWGLQPGLVSILDTIPNPPDSIVEAHRAYWFYARNQSLALDLEILFRALPTKR